MEALQLSFFNTTASPERVSLVPARLLVAASNEELEYMDSSNVSETKKPEYIHHYKYAHTSKRYVSFTQANLKEFINRSLLKTI